MKNEIVYDKYRQRGDYHWRQISRHPVDRSAYVCARYQRCIDLLENHAGALAGKRVMDLGCGDGAFSSRLTQCGAWVIGIDPTLEAIALAAERHRQMGSSASFCAASGYATPFPDSFFDAIVSTDVIEHVQHPERFLTEIHRLLKPGAWAVISTPIRLTERPLDKLHVVEWFPGEFQAMVGSIFPDAHFYYSHPVFWGELARRSKFLRVIVNLIHAVRDPFATTRKWHYCELQYAVCRKPERG